MLAIAVTLLPLPLLAAEGAATAAPSKPLLMTSITEHAKREVLVSPVKTSGSAAVSKTSARAEKKNDPQSGGFFRSSAGIACLAVIAAGTGYAIYSASHDRIHSVARDNQK